MLEKRDLQVRLLESGRVIIACTNDDTPANADPASSTSSSSSTGSANSNGNPSNNNNNSNSSSSAGIGGSNNSSSSSAAGRSDDEIICLPIHYSESAFNSLGLQDLRALYRKLGVSMNGLIEVEEMRRNLVSLGFIKVDRDARSTVHSEPAPMDLEVRIEDIDEAEPAAASTNTASRSNQRSGQNTTAGQSFSGSHTHSIYAPQSVYSSSSSSSSSSSAPFQAGSGPNPASNVNSGAFVLESDLVHSMSVRELKSIMKAYGVDSSNCLEKEDLIERMRCSGKIVIRSS
jgi:hypothetical protein